MDANQDYNCDLVERIKDIFPEICNDIITSLRKTDEQYAALFRETVKLNEDYPIIEHVKDGEGAIRLSADEHAALVKYFQLKLDMEEAEWQNIYFRGHTDNFAYLKKIGAI